MKSIKEIWYRKQIAAHKERVEKVHRGYESAYQYSWDKLLECQKKRSIFIKFPALGEASAKRARKEFDEAKEWTLMARESSKNAQREYKAFRERVGLDG